MLDAPLGDGWLLGHLGNRFMVIHNGASIAADDVGMVDLSDSDVDEEARSRCGLPPGAAMLVRPDQYVAARWLAPTSEKLRAALQTAKGTPALVDA